MTDLHPPKLVVGQKLWFVPSDTRWGREGHEVEVVKVGRKWAELGAGERVDVDTLWVDGGRYVSPGVCCRSREEWEKEKRRAAAAHHLSRGLERGVSPSVPESDIRLAAALLRIEIP